MRRTHGHISATLAGLVLLLGLAACDQAPRGRDFDGDRVSALEAEVAALREEMRARDEALRDELSLVRRSIDAVREALMAGAAPLDGGTAPASPDSPSGDAAREALDDELDIKARTFVKESLDRLLGITKKILDRMDRELDKRDEPPAGNEKTPDGQGDGT
ncbi:hypothetical protein [Pseudodesulfovibrio pelocollis]|uniref:hypothetical protein n=1 Tax=Pseudodesulfovibrio pelocollis TaxID=3051432 RepID=UPI00255B180E|nr:hypothetical protein [Pseudodesulfovibrio sp. SB368]